MPRLVLAIVSLLAGCEGAPQTARSSPRDCRLLLDAAHRARGCDPALGALATALELRGDETQCREAARRLILSPSSATNTIASAIGPMPGDERDALTAAEAKALATRPLPAQLILRPDQPPGPGVPATTAELDGRPLEMTREGALQGRFEPGHRDLELRHAGARSRYCVELHACETLQIVAHGARLARDARAVPGPCR